jgi:RimK-like ATP-grasp domain
MTLFISVNPVASKFAKALQTALRAKVVDKIYRVDHHRAQQKRRANIFYVTPQTLNKIEQFSAFQQANVSCPKAAVTTEGARNLNVKTLFARTLINSTGGRGIIEFESSKEVYPRAPLYTEYIPKKAEYRVHVFNGQVIDVQQKKKRREFGAERDTRIRNLANGYVYTRDGIVPPTGLGDLAINAVNAVGYVYGAVDIIYNEKRNQCYTLEVNSRPGLLGTTLDKYTDALINTFNLRRK